jgi:hypothetical protein
VRRLQLAGQHRHHRVVAQLVVVVQVFVAEGDAGDPLHQQRLQTVHGIGRVAAVLEACRQASGQAEHLVGGAQQQRAGVAGELAAVEGGDHRAATNACKFQLLRVTLCGHRAILCLRVNSLLQKNFRSIRRPMHLIRVRNAG